MDLESGLDASPRALATSCRMESVTCDSAAIDVDDQPIAWYGAFTGCWLKAYLPSSRSSLDS